MRMDIKLKTLRDAYALFDALRNIRAKLVQNKRSAFVKACRSMGYTEREAKRLFRDVEFVLEFASQFKDAEISEASVQSEDQPSSDVGEG